MAAPHTLNTEFEFWFSGEIKINNINEIESKADYFGVRYYVDINMTVLYS
ncbi:phage tail tip protein J-related protein [Proteus mirabilis]